MTLKSKKKVKENRESKEGGQGNVKNEKGVKLGAWGRKPGEDSWRRDEERREKRRRRDGAVGDKVKERPAEFLECAARFVQWEVVCRGAFVAYERVEFSSVWDSNGVTEPCRSAPWFLTRLD